MKGENSNPILRDPANDRYLFQRPIHPDGTIWMFDCLEHDWLVSETSGAWEANLVEISFAEVLDFVRAADRAYL